LRLPVHHRVDDLPEVGEADPSEALGSGNGPQTTSPVLRSLDRTSRRTSSTSAINELGIEHLDRHEPTIDPRSIHGEALPTTHDRLEIPEPQRRQAPLQRRVVHGAAAR
jgi:hypothetical protein